ncbi:acyl-CoA carboxylase subunit epsilon [Streptomyces sp. NPDC008343]|uniref:acyl-CoA carboxylase subunit epsilon n=1 Tax=Streptomyces sp. NPDC008343 TaxID=3364828 RepID=UPI0036E3215F
MTTTQTQTQTQIPTLTPHPSTSALLAATSFKVLRGEPSPEELAAFTAVLSLRLTTPDAPTPQRPTTAHWTRPERLRAYTCPRAWHS